MLLIWGFKVRYADVASGTFYCPHEGGDRPYVKKLAKRWFTFFFIPIFPLNELGQFVECSSCQRGYDERVLTNPTTAQLMDNLANAARQAVTAIIRADGHVDEAEKQAAVEIMASYTDTPYEMQHLEWDLANLPAHGLVEHMTNCAGILNPHGKEALLGACLRLAASDGDVAREEIDLINQAGLALGMTQNHITGVLNAAQNISTSGHQS